MKINIQPIEKYVESDGQTLDVHSIFYTIQGEGPFCGQPAVFIRLAGCNLQCPGCDTDYTKNRQQLSIEQITNLIEQSYQHVTENHLPLIVITGGEPFRQNIWPLVKRLTCFHKVQIETNGTLPVPINWDVKNSNVFIVCSPKTGKVSYSINAFAKWFKYVLGHDSVDQDDGLPIFALYHSASPQVARPPEGAIVYLQPMDSQDPAINAKNQDAVLASCLKYGYTLQLQIHKLIGVE